jgi:hypothetical protein
MMDNEVLLSGVSSRAAALYIPAGRLAWRETPWGELPMGPLRRHRADESLDSALHGKSAQLRRNFLVFVEAAIALRDALWARSRAGFHGAVGSGWYERILLRGKQPGCPAT